MKNLFKIKGPTREDTIENLSIAVLFVAAVFTVIGISVGTWVSGFPVMLAILGAFLVLVGIVLYVSSEFMRIISPKDAHRHSSKEEQHHEAKGH